VLSLQTVPSRAADSTQPGCVSAHGARFPYVRVESGRHYGNLFVLLVGATCKGGKGTSWGRVRSIFEHLPEPVPIVNGLSSGEALKYAVRDTYEKTTKDGDVEIVDEGVSDKRLLALEA
jgi:hypothetical protein